MVTPYKFPVRYKVRNIVSQNFYSLQFPVFRFWISVQNQQEKNLRWSYCWPYFFTGQHTRFVTTGQKILQTAYFNLDLCNITSCKGEKNEPTIKIGIVLIQQSFFFQSKKNRSKSQNDEIMRVCLLTTALLPTVQLSLLINFNPDKTNSDVYKRK